MCLLVGCTFIYVSGTDVLIDFEKALDGRADTKIERKER